MRQNRAPLGVYPETLRLGGAGAAPAGAASSCRLTVGDQLPSKPEQVAGKDKPHPQQPANVDGLPPGTREAGYERAPRWNGLSLPALGSFAIVPGVTLVAARQGHTNAVVGNYLYVFGGNGRRIARHI